MKCDNCEEAKSWCECFDKSQKSKPIEFKWEPTDHTAIRTKVFGGWIVRVYSADQISGGVCFVPDPKHEWKIK